MSRLVQPRLVDDGASDPLRGAPSVKDAVRAGQTTSRYTGDDYKDRMPKYIPGEVLAFYMTADRGAAAWNPPKPMQPTAGDFATAAMSNAEMLFSLKQWLPLIVLIVGLIATPLYIRLLAGSSGAPWRVQAFISMFAFAIWAYAVQGSVFGTLYDPALAAIAVGFFTLVSGAFKPERTGDV